jgi:hypothetical protein
MGRAQGKRGELNERERKFVTAFMGKCAGNATAAAKAAGYSPKTAASIASRLLRKVNIQQGIAARVAADPDVYDKDKLQRFWTAVITAHGEHDDADLGHRLRASELLGKSQRVFVEHLEVTAAADLIELLGGKPLLK